MEQERCLLLTDLPNTLPGWGCCQLECRTYNGVVRTECKYCGHSYCGPAFEIVQTQWFQTGEVEQTEVITRIRRKD